MIAAVVVWVILLISGPCARCGIKHSLPTTDAAMEAALNLQSRMVESGRIDVDELKLLKNNDSYNVNNDDRDMEDLDPSLTMERLYERRGKMFGVLICKGPNSDSESVILKAYAGKLGGQWNLPGWSPIIGRLPESLPVFNRASAEVTEIFGIINDITCNTQGGDTDTDADHHAGEGEGNERVQSQTQTQATDERVKQLIKERARFANIALAEVRRHQLVTNFRGETAPITAIYSRGPTKLPGGVGDCAAPKLLAEAARLGLQPTGIAEIFIGATGGMSTTKGDGQFYDACEQRCEQIAGFMLCGLDVVVEES